MSAITLSPRAGGAGKTLQQLIDETIPTPPDFGIGLSSNGINVGVTAGQIDHAARLTIDAGTDLFMNAGDDWILDVVDNGDLIVNGRFDLETGERTRFIGQQNLSMDYADEVELVAGDFISLAAGTDLLIEAGNDFLAGANRITQFETSVVGGYIRFRSFADDIYFSDVSERTSAWQNSLGLVVSDTVDEWDRTDDKYGNISMMGILGQPFANAVKTLNYDHTIPAGVTSYTTGLTIPLGVSLTIDAGGSLVNL